MKDTLFQKGYKNGDFKRKKEKEKERRERETLQ